MAFIEYLVRQIPNRYNQKAQYLEQHCDSIDILVLGSSHAFMGINPTKLSPYSYNLANVSQSFDYDYYLLEKYIDRCENLESVVLSVSLFSFHSLLADSEPRFAGYYLNGFGITQIPIDFKYRFNILSEQDVFQKIYAHYILKKEYSESTLQGLSTAYSLKNKAKGIRADSNAKERALVHTSNESQNISAITFLTKIINLCTSRQISLYLITTPVTTLYAQHIDQKQYKQMVETVNRATFGFDNVTYINYFEDQSWSLDDDNFYDADHLSTYGADVFTKKLKDDMLTGKTHHLTI